MDAAVIVALIAVAGTVANVGLTYFLNLRSERRRERQKADAVWARYLESFAFAAQELADRIDNILEGYLLEAYRHDSPHKEEAIQSTLFRFCQYFGWSEILRRALRAPDPRYASYAQALERLQGQVGRAFASDRYGPGPFMVWRESQRAVGELMIRQEGEAIDTVGVAGFVADFDKFKPWVHRMEGLMRDEPSARWPAGERDRLQDIQSALQTLADELRGTLSR